MSRLALFSAAVLSAFVSGSATSYAHEPSLVAIDCPRGQESKQLLKYWNQLPPQTRKTIETTIVTDEGLGLSAVGVVQLVGVYNYPDSGKDEPKRLFHLRQTDQVGSSLMWSILVNAEQGRYRILFHSDELRRRRSSWLTLGDGIAQAKKEERAAESFEPRVPPITLEEAILRLKEHFRDKEQPEHFIDEATFVRKGKDSYWRIATRGTKRETGHAIYAVDLDGTVELRSVIKNG